MLIHREGWLYSGRTPAFFSGQSGCYCCGVGVGSLVYAYGVQTGATRIRDVDSYVVDTWTSKADATTPARSNSAGATVSGIAYVFGGLQSSSPFYMDANQSYVLSSDTWTAKTAMTAARHYHAAFASDTKVYSTAGQDNTATLKRTTYEYDVAGDSWATKTDCPTPARQFAKACRLGHNGYLIGGTDGTVTTYADNDQYNTGTDTWTGKTDIATNRFGHVCFAVDGYGYACVGNNAAVLLDTIEQYDEGGNSWSYGPDLTTISPAGAKRYHGAGESPGSTSSGFATGGLGGSGAAVRDHQEFTPVTGSMSGAYWTGRTQIPLPARWFMTCVESV